MARLLGYFIKQEGCNQVNVLVATSGDTGSAVANGFLGVEGIHVYVLYPKGKVSAIQECQFTTLGQNITALEVDGVFDDCQALVKNAFMDEELNRHMKLTSANSINVARFLPQAFYYFYAYAQMKKFGKADQLVVCVPKFRQHHGRTVRQGDGLAGEAFHCSQQCQRHLLQLFADGRIPSPCVGADHRQCHGCGRSQ